MEGVLWMAKTMKGFSGGSNKWEGGAGGPNSNKWGVYSYFNI